MFVTSPQMEQWVPVGLGEEGNRFWSVFGLGVEMPWFLLTLVVPDVATQTLAVSWESTLRDVINSADVDSIVEINRISRVRGLHGGWRLQHVTELWEPSGSEASVTGPLIFSFSAGTELMDSHGRRAGRDVPGRKLLISLKGER